MPNDFPGLTAHRRYLDAAFPDRPVVIRDRDGHQALANSRALELAGVTAATPDPEDGRIEHIEAPALADLPRFKSLGVIASTQAIFATPDEVALQSYVPLLGPTRAPHANAFRMFDQAGAVQAFGSDYPVFPMDPLLGIFTASTRPTPAGEPRGGWYPENRIPIEAALEHYTRDAAFASFEEDLKGTLTPGKYADFVVLSADILALPPERMLEASVLLTVMGGRETWRAPGFDPAIVAETDRAALSP